MHEPMNIEYKKLEFENSAPGTIGLESCFGLLSNIFPIDKVLSFLTRGTECFEIQSPSIAEGKTADLTWFDPEKIVRLKENDLRSTAKNCAYLGLTLPGAHRLSSAVLELSQDCIVYTGCSNLGLSQQS